MILCTIVVITRSNSQILITMIYYSPIHDFVLTTFIFYITGVNNKSAQVLLLLVIPGHLIFLYTIHLMKSGHTSLTVIFVVVYLFAAVLQVREKTSCNFFYVQINVNV